MIEEQVIKNKSLGISKTFNELMAETCPVWAWTKQKDLERKKMKF